MGKVIIHNSVSANSAFEAPTPENWLELDADSGGAGLEQLILADALLLGRKTYEGLAAVWPHLGEDPTMGYYAERINGMPKYVASRTVEGPLAWNATLIEDEVTKAVARLKKEHTGNLIITGCGELAHTLARHGLVDEFWFWVSPNVWPDGPRILEGVGPIRLQLIATTSYRSGVVWLRYRSAEV
ncbi:dihydrofolate reductase family protein [Micromonospora sp. WMMD1102]|uniref:dihydrofolate reductase family protein n=1 Tax=Micromonospora sp. WMMD1102 TaxID=3016105 RepID=UPI002415878F|nr:dihydrofolate reductase family protein [Micromonospora sp. WMMD1102]MDG4791766.1 dihydrofolate reductase family protein [Micromonospora sp. WMMD1102]